MPPPDDAPSALAALPHVHLPDPLRVVLPVMLPASYGPHLAEVAALIRAVDPEAADRFSTSDVLLYALDLAAEQARDFTARLARLRTGVAMT